MPKFITIRGAREHNLRSVDLEIPRNLEHAFALSASIPDGLIHFM